MPGTIGSNDGNEKITAGQWISLANSILNMPMVKAATKDAIAMSSGV